MVDEYIQMKFNKSHGGDANLVITLQGFEVAQQMDDNLRALTSLGGEGTAQGKVICSVTLKRKGKKEGVKKIITTADEPYNTATTDMKVVYSKARNAAANRALFMINAYIDSIGLQ